MVLVAEVLLGIMQMKMKALVIGKLELIEKKQKLDINRKKLNKEREKLTCIVQSVVVK